MGSCVCVSHRVRCQMRVAKGHRSSLQYGHCLVVEEDTEVLPKRQQGANPFPGVDIIIS